MDEVTTRREFLAAIAAMSIVAATGCDGTDEEGDPMSTSSRPTPQIALPQPVDGTLALEQVLRRRRSVREFAPRDLTDAELGQLLWAAQGVTSDSGGRTAPSAGALYPLEVYAITPEHALHYVPAGHRARVVVARDLRSDLRAAALDQSAVGTAPAVVAIVVVPDRTAAKYGDRASRYVDLEAGHAAQNVLLQAVALGLAAVPIGAFDDDEVAQLLALPEGHQPRYLIPVGQPLADDPG